MRGVAALAVVVLHAREAIDRQGFIDHPLGSGTSIGEFANLGAVGVDLFFVISGFVMALTASKLDGWAGARRFLRGRVARIVPLFWLLSLPMVAWWAAKGAPLLSLNALNSLTFVPLHVGPYAFPFHGVGWTLSFEFAFYGLVAVTIAAPRDLRVHLLLAMLVTLPLLPLQAQPWTLGRWLTNPMLLEFGFGVVAFMLWERGRLDRHRRAAAVGAVCAVAVLAVQHVAAPAAMLTPNGVTHQGLGGLRTLLVGLPCLLLFLWALPFRASRWLVELGEASYSLYLVHPPVMVAAGYVLPRSTPGDAAFALLVAASVGAALLIYRCIERPMDDALREPKDAPSSVMRSQAGRSEAAGLDPAG